MFNQEAKHPGERMILRWVKNGMFSIGREGRIWRHKVRRATKIGPPIVPCDARRAEVKNNTGYLQVFMSIKGKKYSALAHRLVWSYFKGPIPKGLEVNHKNGDKADNRLRNLELVTRRENALHAHKKGLCPKQSKRNKFSSRQVKRLRKEYVVGDVTLAALSERTGVTIYALSKMMHGHSYSKAGGPVLSRFTRRSRRRLRPKSKSTNKSSVK